MLICRAANLEAWQPDFTSSAQSDSTWTRVSVPEGQLTNALNAIDWNGNPAQVLLCESCGIVGCAAGGYVHVSRVGGWMLWTTGQAGSDNTLQEPEHPIVRRNGGIAVPRAEWERWRGVLTDLPAFESIRHATGKDLADAWRMSVVGPGRATRLEEVVPTLRERLLHAERLSVDQALEAAATMVARLEELVDVEVSGQLATPDALGVRIETFYFDAPEVTAWPALALGRTEPLLVLSPDLVFLPDE